MDKLILVIEDEAPIVEILKFNLTKSGYVIPIVDFENIQYVFVITERKTIK